MNIDELALKVAKVMNRAPKCRDLGAISNDEAIHFARALIAEYEADQGEAVAWRCHSYISAEYEHEKGFWSNNWSYTTDKPSERYAGSECNRDITPLFLRPDPRVKELEAEVERLRDAGVEMVMAMSDTQINALAAIEGSSPDDIATIGKQCFEIAKYRVQVAELERQLAEARKDTERLDFIEAHPEMHLTKHKKHWAFKAFTSYEYDAFTALRKAIDAAKGGE